MFIKITILFLTFFCLDNNI